MRRFSVFSVLTLLSLLASMYAGAQNTYLMGQTPDSVVLCDDVRHNFFDDGGQAGDYNQLAARDTLTFSSKLSTKGVIHVAFTRFFADPEDTLFVYSDRLGVLTLIDTLYANPFPKRGLVNDTIHHYSLPGDGSLTYIFVPRNPTSTNREGWSAKVREASAFATVEILELEDSISRVTIVGDTFKTCSPNTMVFDAVLKITPATVVYNGRSYTYLPDTTNFTYQWTFNDGSSPETSRRITKNFVSRGSYEIVLQVITDKCRVIDRTVRVNVSTVPSFAGTTPDQVICQGSTVQLTGNATATEGRNILGTGPYRYTPVVSSDGWIAVGSATFTQPNGNTVEVPGPNALPGVYEYKFQVTDDAFCVYDTTIQVTVNKKVFAGSDTIHDFCANTVAYNLFRSVPDTANGNGTGVWRDLTGGGQLLPPPSEGNIKPNDIATGNTPVTIQYSYLVRGNQGCKDDSSVATITFYPTNFAGTDNDTTVCNNTDDLDLLLLLRGTNPNGTWVSSPPTFAGTRTGNILDLTTGGGSSSGAVDGGAYDWRYTVNNGVCPSDEAVVTVNVREIGIAGEDNSIKVCSVDNTFLLLDSLNGNPQGAGGTWTLDVTPPFVYGGVNPNITFDPAIQTVNGTAVNLYTVRQNFPVCPDVSATLTMEYQKSPKAGTANNPVEIICSNQGTYDLFDALTGEDTYGTFNDDDASGILSGNTLNLNNVDFSSGDDQEFKYTYTVASGNPTCTDDQETVTIRITRGSNAGEDTAFTICESTPIFFLIDSLGGNPGNEGYFRGNGQYFPLTPPNALARYNPANQGGATYFIEYFDSSKGPGCPHDSATLAITVSDEAVAGADNSKGVTCENQPSFALSSMVSGNVPGTNDYYTLFGEDLPNPTWLGNDGLITLQAPSFPGCGIYKFEFHAVTPGCPEDIAVLTLNVKCLPDAGPDKEISICTSEETFDLFPLMSTTDSTGNWKEISTPASNGLVAPPSTGFDRQFDPSRVQRNDTVVLAYIINSPECMAVDTAILKIFLSVRPKAGLGGDTMATCEDENAYDLYDLLGSSTFDRRGTWELVMEPQYDPAINSNGNDITFFSGPDKNIYDVERLMGIIENSNTPFFRDRNTDFPPYLKFKYTVSDTTAYSTSPLCPDSSVFVYLEVSKKFPTPTAKKLTNTDVCITDGDFNLNSLLNNFDFFRFTPDYKLIWSAPGVPDFATFGSSDSLADSLLNARQLTPGEYVFTVSILTEGCPAINVSGIKVKIIGEPNAGISASKEVCITDNFLNLLTVLGGNPDKDGRFTGPNVGGYKDAQSVIDPSRFPEGTYVFKYTVVGSTCPGTRTADATVIIVAEPNPGPDQTIEICAGDEITLSTYYTNSITQNGTFTSDCPGALENGNDFSIAKFNSDGINPSITTCVVTYTATKGSCAPRSSRLTIKINPRPTAGDDTEINLCSSAGIVDMYPLIGGNKMPGGKILPEGSPYIVKPTSINTATAPTSVVLEYVVSSPGCVADRATLTINVEKAPTAGTDGTIIVCENAPDVNLLTDVLTGNPDTDGEFTTILPFLFGPGNRFFKPSDFGVGTHVVTYTVTGVFCPNDVSEATVRVVPRPRSGRADTTAVLCSNIKVYDLNDALGTKDVDYTVGNWFFNGVPVSSRIQPDQLPFGSYTYRHVVTANNCAPSETFVTVTISPAPFAGPDADTTVCLNVNNLDLRRVQIGNGTGTFIPPGTANGFNEPIFDVSANSEGTYIFRREASAVGCPKDTAYITVIAIKSPNAGASITKNVCLNGLNIDLKDLRSTTSYDSLGKFTVSNVAGTNNQRIINNSSSFQGSIFKPHLVGAGTYTFTYTVTSKGCGPDTATLTLFVVAPGRDTAVDVCRLDSKVDLNQLTGASNLYVNWSGAPSPILVGKNFSPSAANINEEYTLVLNYPFDSPYGCATTAKITVRDTMSISGLVRECNGDNTYTVSFYIKGGALPHTVDDAPFGGYVIDAGGDSSRFISNKIPTGATYNYTIGSKISCGDLILRGSSAAVCTDNDGDGITDAIDLDDDNDGINDLRESFGFNATDDDNADGTPNYNDPAYCTSKGGSLNSFNVCSVFDADNDGKINQYDLDSDNDNISDLFEGLPGIGQKQIDGSPLNGIVPGPYGLDGWADVAQQLFGTGTPIPNTDQTDFPDMFDFDSDNDGICDLIEGNGSPALNVEPANTDGDVLTYDYRDLDSDNDSIPDSVEGGGDCLKPFDTDGDLTFDFRDKDSDNDGITDNYEWTIDPLKDFDGDGLANYRDTDSDNDNLTDIEEGFPSSNPRRFKAGNRPDFLNVDTDGDGIYDLYEGHLVPGDNIVSNFDGVGEPDYRDLDSDNDQISDSLERGNYAVGAEPVNTDNQGSYDFRDMDADGDGLSDNFEAGPTKSAPLNSDSASAQPDTSYDFQDVDSDGDCIPDEIEAIAPYDKNFVADTNKAYDFDGDGVYDYLSEDSDGDGISDAVEAGPDCDSPANTDSDNDIFPDFRDLDSDNDGTNDRIEKDTDCDNDGKPNYIDAGDNCEITTFVPEGFSPNGDGINDFFEIPELTEFPGASLKIFNRWGAVIFETNDYNNRWNGKYKDEEVSAGTYFYLLDLGIQGQEAIKGYVYINR